MANINMKPAIAVRPAKPADLEKIAAVHKATFTRQSHSLEWVTATAGAYPRMRYFLAELEAQTIGYVVWAEKSGFRKEAVIELEQIAVLPEYRGQGVGRALIRSLVNIEEQLKARDARIKAVLVTTRSDNKAGRLYQTELGAQVQAMITDLYSADEVIMVAKNPIAHLAASDL